MGKVLVGFDFSKGAAHAVDVAIDMANRMQLDLRLVYVKKEGEDEGPVREEIERRNAAVAHLLEGIKMEYAIREGKVSRELCLQAKEDDAQVIVVGSCGMAGFKRNWIGRNTYSTITESEVPVLTLPENFVFNKTFRRIVTPIDSSADTRQKLPTAVQFAKLFDSEICVLGLYTSTNKDIRSIVNSYVRMVDEFLTKNEIRHSCRLAKVPKNLTVTTLEYAKKVSADMIVIMTEQESTLASFFMGTYAQQMLTSSTIPILSVRPEMINNMVK